MLPTRMLGGMLGLNKRRGDEEASLLFTSGSSGEPKGVVLSHRNVLANVTQFSSRLDLTSGSSILGCLPLFHSFGSTVTLWFPIIEGVNLVKKHQRPQGEGKPGGIIDKDMPMHVSNVAALSPKDGKSTRIGYKVLEDGTKVRVCKRTGAEF